MRLLPSALLLLLGGQAAAFSTPPAAPATASRRSGSSALRSKQKSAPNDVSPSSFEGTSGIAKGIVSGLTSAFVAVAAPKAESATATTAARRALTPRQVFKGISADFTERKYLWTGDIEDDLYCEDCLFTDPTLSFRGLSTWKKNVGSLRPLVNALVPEFGVDLLSCELFQREKCVRARWRMWGDIKLPWNPSIDVIGRTTFTYDPKEGNRIVDYYEQWELPASTALLQLVTPGKRRAKQ